MSTYFLALVVLTTLAAGAGSLGAIAAVPQVSPWWLLIGGVASPLYITAGILLFARLGALTTVGLFVTGQMAASLVLDLFGLAVPLRPLRGMPWWGWLGGLCAPPMSSRRSCSSRPSGAETGRPEICLTVQPLARVRCFRRCTPRVDQRAGGQSMDLKLAGPIAVVTGASKGIGLATTRTLLAEGARVAAASRRSSPELDSLASPGLAHVPVDLMDPAAPWRMIARAVQVFGGSGILVNVAGGPPPGVKLPQFPFLTPSDADWVAMFEFNLFSAVRAARAAIRVMLERGGGAIVNVSSGHARQPSGVNVDYGAAKAGLNNLTQALSEEFAPRGVRVNGVPGSGPHSVVDRRRRRRRHPGCPSRHRPRLCDRHRRPAEMMNLTTGRLVDPQEVADVIALLVSPRSSSTTGADFIVERRVAQGRLARPGRCDHG